MGNLMAQDPSMVGNYIRFCKRSKSVSAEKFRCGAMSVTFVENNTGVQTAIKYPTLRLQYPLSCRPKSLSFPLALPGAPQTYPASAGNHLEKPPTLQR